MTDFSKSSKIILKRNGFWIVLFMILSLMILGVITKNEIEWTTHNLGNTLQNLEDFSKGDFSKMGQVPYDQYGKIIKEKHPIMNKEVFDSYNKNYEFLVEKYGKERPTESYDEKYEPYIYDSFSAIDNYGRFKEDNGLFFNLTSTDFGMFLLITLMAFLFTSMEHLTSYFEFTRMLPFSKEKSFLMKIGLGLILIIGFFILSKGLQFLMWNVSYLGELIQIGKLPIDFLKTIFVYICYFLVLISVGAVAGNIIGHVGMLIIVLGGPALLVNIFMLTTRILGFGFEFKKIYQFEVNIRNTALEVIYKPIVGFSADSASEILGLGIITIIIFALGYYWAKTAKAERTQMLILSKGVSIYANILAVITTSVVMSQIFSDAFIGNGENLFGIVFLVFTGFLAYKVYKILFKIKIGV